MPHIKEKSLLYVLNIQELSKTHKKRFQPLAVKRKLTRQGYHMFSWVAQNECIYPGFLRFALNKQINNATYQQLNPINVLNIHPYIYLSGAHGPLQLHCGNTQVLREVINEDDDDDIST